MNKIARREAAAYGYGSGYDSYAPKHPTLRPRFRRKRRWDLDDTSVSDPAASEWSQSGRLTARPTQHRHGIPS